MNVEVFALCDAANGADHRLCLLGVFDCIYAAQVPMVHPRFEIVLRLRYTRMEEGQYEISITIMDEDGNPVVPVWKRNLATCLGPEEESLAGNIVIHIDKFPIPNYGSYSVNLAINGSHTASLPLLVKPLPSL